MKTLIVPSTCTLEYGDVSHTKIVNFNKLDAVIEAYRVVTQKHRYVIDYYGFHIVSNLSVMLLSILLTAYYSWIKAVTSKGEMNSYCVFTKVVIDLVNIATISAISESTDTQVREYIHYTIS